MELEVEGVEEGEEEERAGSVRGRGGEEDEGE